MPLSYTFLYSWHPKAGYLILALSIAIVMGCRGRFFYITISMLLSVTNLFNNQPNTQYAGSFAKLRKAANSFVITGCPPVCMDQLCSYEIDFHEI
jgi:hypothetical protein